VTLHSLSCQWQLAVSTATNQLEGTVVNAILPWLVISQVRLVLVCLGRDPLTFAASFPIISCIQSAVQSEVLTCVGWLEPWFGYPLMDEKGNMTGAFLGV
jgi:hypothetical protein